MEDQLRLPYATDRGKLAALPENTSTKSNNEACTTCIHKFNHARQSIRRSLEDKSVIACDLGWEGLAWMAVVACYIQGFAVGAAAAGTLTVDPWARSKTSNAMRSADPVRPTFFMRVRGGAVDMHHQGAPAST